MVMMNPQDRLASDRRDGERITYTEHLRVRKPTSQHAIGADISARGISIVVPQQIEEGTQVELEMFGGTVFVSGKVTKVSPGIRGFRVGIQFSEEQPTVLAKAKGARR